MAKVTKNVVPDPPYTVTIELSQEESATRHANYACCYFHRIKGGIMTETSDLRERVAGLVREWLWNREHNEAGMTTPGELADAVLAARPAPVVSGEVPRLSDDAAMDMWWTACDDAWAVPEYLPGEFLRLALAHMGITAADAPAADDEGGQEGRQG